MVSLVLVQNISNQQNPNIHSY